MPTIQDNILEEFYKKLSASEGFSQTMIEQLRGLLEADKKLNATALVTVFTGGAEENLP